MKTQQENPLEYHHDNREDILAKPIEPANVIDDVIEQSQVTGEYSKELSQNMYASHYRQFRAFLDMKIKDNLMSQLVQSHTDEDRQSGYINLTEVGKVLSVALEQELTRHVEQINYLESKAIPDAFRRPDFQADDAGNPSAYILNDSINLFIRNASHKSMVEFVSHLQTSTDEEAAQLAEFAVKQLLPDARDAVISMLTNQKKELEVGIHSTVERIEELEQTIDSLSTDIDSLQAEIADRDILLLDKELVAHLTEEARQLATDYNPDLNNTLHV